MISKSDKNSLVRLASVLPKGSSERKALLAGLQKISAEELRDGWHSIEEASGTFPEIAVLGAVAKSLNGKITRGGVKVLRGTSLVEFDLPGREALIAETKNGRLSIWLRSATGVETIWEGSPDGVNPRQIIKLVSDALEDIPRKMKENSERARSEELARKKLRSETRGLGEHFSPGPDFSQSRRGPTRRGPKNPMSGGPSR